MSRRAQTIKPTSPSLAALLSSDRDNTDKVVRLISEARSMGITVRPPSVNASSHDFTVDQGAVRFGLGAVKGVGGGAVESILAAREDVAFEGLLDFCDRVDTRRVNREPSRSQAGPIGNQTKAKPAQGGPKAEPNRN